MKEITSDKLRNLKFVDGIRDMLVLRTEKIAVMVTEIDSKWYVSLSGPEHKTIQLGEYEHIEEICTLLVGLKI